jgi:hypothetical protein
VVESDGLENRCALTGTVGSNPTLSAISILDLGLRILDWLKSAFLSLSTDGKVQERLNWQHWKCCVPQKGTVGSNPTLSAISIWDLGLRIWDLRFVSIPNPKSAIPNQNYGFRLRTRFES